MAVSAPARSKVTTSLRPVLVVTVLFIVVSQVTAVLLPNLLADGSALSARQVTLAVLVAVFITEACIAAGIARRERRLGTSWRQLGLTGNTSTRAVVAGVVVGVVYGLLTVAIPTMRAQPLLELSLFKLAGVVSTAVGAAAFEEFVFRGWMIDRFVRRGLSRRAQVLLSGLGFASFHGVGAPTTFILGVILAVIYTGSARRSLVPAIVGHGIVNLIIEPWLFLSFVQAYT